MWWTVLALALVATADPVRLGASVALYSRPRPVRHMFAFWLGGAMVTSVLAMIVLVWLRDFASGAIHRVQLITASSAAGHIQIVIGAIALVVAALAFSLRPGRRARVGMPVPSRLPLFASTAVTRLSTRAQDALRTRALWFPFLLGVGLLTDFRCLLALSAMVAAGAARATEITATAAFALVSLAFIEIPLASQLAAPEKTGKAMSRVYTWMNARQHRVAAAIVALLGAFLVTRGIRHI